MSQYWIEMTDFTYLLYTYYPWFPGLLNNSWNVSNRNPNVQRNRENAFQRNWVIKESENVLGNKEQNIEHFCNIWSSKWHWMLDNLLIGKGKEICFYWRVLRNPRAKDVSKEEILMETGTTKKLKLSFRNERRKLVGYKQVELLENARLEKHFEYTRNKMEKMEKRLRIWINGCRNNNNNK